MQLWPRGILGERQNMASTLRAIAVLAVLCLAPVQQAAACSIRTVAELFAYDARTQFVLSIEAAMARAQAKHGYIPDSAAEEITRQARAEKRAQPDPCADARAGKADL